MPTNRVNHVRTIFAIAAVADAVAAFNDGTSSAAETLARIAAAVDAVHDNERPQSAA